ncbi:flagellar biosynthesis anti-sigma factor FlgM [Tepidimonas sediminis]|uniref:Negative regulator of flagellin synthesis n=1 Tax=Tepidimonas sediminis TaxID=2588941 RepID=A0A554WTH3_9BURK|nr:flagellar biosynthesis anti-sigma factor FlgM [Tepidimonas sediminis]TSE26882.1 flagellar biosynthesis anti-sigma factor FlgM [Tepidimonas sediminis]
MKINQSPDAKFGTPVAATPKRPDPGAGPVASAPAAESAASTVKLSPVTQAMTNGVARSGTDVFDAAKVEAMRTAIQNGSFSVNAEAIADRLLASAREMLGVAAAGPRARG